MKNYKIEIKIVSEFDIKIDETIWTQEEINKWANFFQPAESIKEFTEHLAVALANNGTGVFLEGFGHVKTFYSSGKEMLQFGKGVKKVEDFTEGIEVTVISEGESYTEDIEEIEV